MATPARYFFETDFSKPDEPEELEAVFVETAQAPIAAYLQTLAAAEARGYARGVADGRNEVEAQARAPARRRIRPPGVGPRKVSWQRLMPIGPVSKKKRPNSPWQPQRRSPAT